MGALDVRHWGMLEGEEAKASPGWASLGAGHDSTNHGTPALSRHVGQDVPGKATVGHHEAKPKPLRTNTSHSETSRMMRLHRNTSGQPALRLGLVQSMAFPHACRARRTTLAYVELALDPMQKVGRG